MVMGPEGRYFDLIHVTPSANCESINEHGLLLSKNTGGAPVIWLATQTTELLAIQSCQRWHGQAEVTVYLATIPRTWIRQWDRHIWCCLRDIPRRRLKVKAKVRQLLTVH